MSNTFSFDDDEEDASPFGDEPTETEALDGGSVEPEGESGNRAFYIVGIILGVLFLCTLIAGAAYALLILPGQQTARSQAESTLESVNTQAAIAVALTQEVLNYTPTLPPTETPTPEPTFTPVLVDPATETPGAGVVVRDANADATATVQALNTELAYSQLTATMLPAVTVTALSDTGFADDVGLPGLFIGALVLIAIIFLVRRLREAPLKS
ncbi:MAG: hypothetical protein RBS68_13260 [Anaerolineales bacterium]|jgi:hypothetical protein|nr:hypothetical protein [Anaerolineales bacterium]